jgi:hypothetical protein
VPPHRLMKKLIDNVRKSNPELGHSRELTCFFDKYLARHKKEGVFFF